MGEPRSGPPLRIRSFAPVAAPLRILRRVSSPSVPVSFGRNRGGRAFFHRAFSPSAVGGLRIGPGLRAGLRPVVPVAATLQDRHDQTRRSKYKSTAAWGRKHLGPSEVPGESPRIRPGQYGQRRRASSRTSAPAQAKQKLRAITATFRSASSAALRRSIRRRATSGDNLIGLLERWLDAIVYRAKFVPTVFAARQFVNHGHVKVNGVASTSPPTTGRSAT